MSIIDQSAPAVTVNSPVPTSAESKYADRRAWRNGWCDLCLDSYPGESWDEPGYQPTLEEHAEEQGYQAGLEGQDAGVSPSRLGWRGWTWTDAAMFYYCRGRLRGRDEREIRLERERIEYEAWLEELAVEDAMEERYAYFHPCEVIEAVGCVEARKG